MRLDFHLPQTGPPVRSLVLCLPHPRRLILRLRALISTWRRILIICPQLPGSLTGGLLYLRPSTSTSRPTWRTVLVPPSRTRNWTLLVVLARKFLLPIQNTTSLLHPSQTLGPERSIMLSSLGDALGFSHSGKLSHLLYFLSNLPYLTRPYVKSLTKDMKDAVYQGFETFGLTAEKYNKARSIRVVSIKRFLGDDLQYGPGSKGLQDTISLVL